MSKLAASSYKPKSKQIFFINKKEITTFIIALFGFFLGRVSIFKFINPIAISFLGNFLGKGYKFYIIAFFTSLGLLNKFSGIYFLKYILSIIFLCGFEAMAKIKNINLKIIAKAITTSISVLITSVSIYYIYGNSFYFIIITILESILVFSLTFILKDGLNILYGNNVYKIINNEQLISLSIVLGAIVAGTADIYIYNISLKLILCTFIILIIAWQGGSAIGSTGGVLLGFMLTITGNCTFNFVGILSIGGMLGGIMKHIGKYGTVVGFAIGSTITALYLDIDFIVKENLYSIIIASIIFFIFPQKFYFNFKTLIDTGVESSKDYILRVKELTTHKLQDFSKSFDKLANTFKYMAEKKLSLNKKDLSKLIDEVANKTCIDCKNRVYCWEENFYNTYQNIFLILDLCEKDGYANLQKVPKNFLDICYKHNNFLDNINKTFDIFKNNLFWYNQIAESKELVSQQLKGVSYIIKNLSKELDIDFCFKSALEEELLKELSRNKIEIDSIVVLENSKGRFEVTINFYSKNKNSFREIINISNKILERRMKKEDDYKNFIFANENKLFKLRLIEEERFKTATGVSRVTKDNSNESGDTYSFMNIKSGQSVLILADGMGSGKKAKEESNSTVELLEEFINTGFDKETAIKIINSVLVLKSNEEIFSTLDICSIDLYTGVAEFIKIGASSTFIIRDGKVKIIKNFNLPIGILSNVDVDITNKILKDGDIVVMVTDGLTEINIEGNYKEEWIVDTLSKFKSNNPQDISDNLLKEAIKLSNNFIKDDMTVMATRIWEKI